MINIGVIFGGNSSEYGVSLHSTCGVINALDSKKYSVKKIWITREGKWYLFEGGTDLISQDKRPEELSFPLILSQNSGEGIFVLKNGEITKLEIDLLFPVLHGRNGEDGTVQGLAELSRIPYAGCKVLSSALCMDKYRAHKLVETQGINIPKSVLISNTDSVEEIREKALSLGFPVFVKPLRAGSSYGIGKAYDVKSLETAVKQAFLYDDSAVFEESIEGNEVGCAVIGRERLLTGELDMITLEGELFDYNEKYLNAAQRITVPVNLPPQKSAEIKEIAKKIYAALDCSDFARVDMFLAKSGKIYFNEVNTIPGFTPHSRFPKMMAAAGYSMTETLDMIVKEALK